jgi:DNA-binding response OmpR family regulator
MRPQEPLVTVLLVDRDTQLGQKISTMLTRGYRVLEAENAERALQHLLKHTPDLVIVDLTLSDSGGEQLVRELRQRHALLAVPILFVTASTDATSRARMLQWAGQDYLLRPFEPAELRARVQNLVGMRREQQAHRDIVDLVNMASHELRGPLGAIELQIELLRRELAGSQHSKQSDILTRLACSSARLTDLVASLAQCAGIESGSVAIHATALDLSTIVAETVERLRARAATKAVTLRFHNDAGATPIVSDPELVRLIVASLCDSAIKRSSAGEIVVSVDRGTGGARLCVTESDPGYPPFEHSGHLGVSSDLLFGLSLTKRVAAALGAEVAHEQLDAMGVRFSVAFPG